MIEISTGPMPAELTYSEALLDMNILKGWQLPLPPLTLNLDQMGESGFHFPPHPRWRLPFISPRRSAAQSRATSCGSSPHACSSSTNGAPDNAPAPAALPPAYRAAALVDLFLLGAQLVKHEQPQNVRQPGRTWPSQAGLVSLRLQGVQ